jgi:hypothetical protein
MERRMKQTLMKDDQGAGNAIRRCYDAVRDGVRFSFWAIVR